MWSSSDQKGAVRSDQV